MQPPRALRARFVEADETAKDSRIPDGIRKWEDHGSDAVTLPPPVLLLENSSTSRLVRDRRSLLLSTQTGGHSMPTLSKARGQYVAHSKRVLPVANDHNQFALIGPER